MDLITILPHLSTKPFSNLLPSLEKNQITTTDLLTFDAVHVAKRAQLPAREIRRLTDAVLQALQQQLGLSSAQSQDEPEATQHGTVPPSLVASGHDLVSRWQTISTLDDAIDKGLGGGIPTGYLTEVTGESGAGKTQLLLTLLLSVQLLAPHGISRSALYISTEGPLQTSRLSQILSAHPRLSSLPNDDPARPSLSRVLSIQTPDLESQEHILRYQLPVAIHRHSIGLVVIDSVSANYRAEFDRPGGAAMAKRSAQLVETGALLRELARTENIAIVVANQVADRFEPMPTMTGHDVKQEEPSSNPATAFPTSQQRGFFALELSSTPNKTKNPLTLDHQQRWFTGWGDEDPSMDTQGLKTPSLGLVWTNQIACRIALIKRPVRTVGVVDTSSWRRYVKIVFAPWVAGADGERGVEFVITNYGIGSVRIDLEGKGDGVAGGGDCLFTHTRSSSFLPE